MGIDYRDYNLFELFSSCFSWYASCFRTHRQRRNPRTCREWHANDLAVFFHYDVGIGHLAFKRNAPHFNWQSYRPNTSTCFRYWASNFRTRMYLYRRKNRRHVCIYHSRHNSNCCHDLFLQKNTSY